MVEIDFSGERIELHGSGLIRIPKLGLLCAADIHFEKGSFFGRFGTLLPPYDTEETLGRLSEAIAEFRPSIFVALGDSFHDASAAERMNPILLKRLNALIESVEAWVWVVGNHDPAISPAIAGRRSDIFTQGGILFRHEADPAFPGPEISGHYHPKARITLAGQFISAPCFARSGGKLILPAFGAYTGGLDVNSAGFLRLMPRANHSLYLIYKDRVYPLPK